MSDSYNIKPLLKINDMKTYFYTKRGIVPAVDNVSLEILKGQIVGLWENQAVEKALWLCL